MLDADAVDALLDRTHPRERVVRRALEAARRLGREVVIPTLTLAELHRGASRSHEIDALLSRHGGGLVLRDTDRRLARLVGALLADAGAGAEDVVDAHAVAVAVEDGGGIVLTGDPAGLERLAGHQRTVVVETLRR